MKNAFILNVLTLMCGAVCFFGCSSSSYELIGKNDTAADLNDCTIKLGTATASLGVVIPHTEKSFGLFSEKIADTATVSWTDGTGKEHTVKVGMGLRTGTRLDGSIRFHIHEDGSVVVEFEVIPPS